MDGWMNGWKDHFVKLEHIPFSSIMLCFRNIHSRTLNGTPSSNWKQSSPEVCYSYSECFSERMEVCWLVIHASKLHYHGFFRSNKNDKCSYILQPKTKLSMLMHVLPHNVFQFRQGFCQINATSMQIANFKDLETSENFRLLRGLLPFC